MFTPSDEKIAAITEEAADDLISQLDMELDEGEWGSRISRRCDELGLTTSEYVKIREVCEEIICIQLAKSILARIVVGEEE